MLMAFALGRCTGGMHPAPAPAHSEDHSARQAEIWTCSMHPQIRMPQPGKCPICHMDLIPVEDDPDDAPLDPRSLRLNFELNLEVVGAESVSVLLDHARQRLHASTPLTLQELDARGLLTRLRDGVFWLLMPYL